MITYYQPLPQLLRIIKHHVAKFPNLITAFYWARGLPSDGDTYTRHPVFILSNWIDWPGSWNYTLRVGDYIHSSFPNEPQRNKFLVYSDQPDVFIFYNVGKTILWPLSIFGPADGYKMEEPVVRLRTKSRAKYWFQYEFGRLLRPYNQALRDASYPLRRDRLEGGEPRADDMNAFYSIVLPLALQALDYVVVGVRGVWQQVTPKPPSFYTWYEKFRTLPKEYLEALRVHPETMNLQAVPGMCPECMNYTRDCSCDEGAENEPR